MLTREALLAAKGSCPKETVNIPELGGNVVVQGMTAKELLAFQKGVERKGKKFDEENFAFKLLVICLKDEAGERLLTDEDLPAIQEWPSTIFQRLTEAAMRLNGYGGNASGPLPETASEDSSSASPSA